VYMYMYVYRSMTTRLRTVDERRCTMRRAGRTA
jgi:hypothetical protein